MALSIHTNYSALVTQSNLTKTNNALSTNQQRLGTGFRVNSAADDAAGLQIATRLNAQSRGMGVALRNINDATSMLQTAEGAFNELTDIVQRMKDLATQAANGTNSDDDKKALQAEFKELGAEVTNILDNTKFAGKELLKKGGGAFESAVSFQIGASTSETLSLDINAALKLVNGTTATGNLPKALVLDLTAVSSDTAGPKAAIEFLGKALDEIGSVRAALGANINRLGHTANNLANMKDNTDVAKGTILDADFASESANMTKNSMLMQSGISMLKQAGQMPSMVMSLLG